jgi:hypothetical protein
LAKGRSTPDAVKVQAAKTMAQWEADDTTTEHPVFEALVALTSEKRRALIRTLR